MRVLSIFFALGLILFTLLFSCSEEYEPAEDQSTVSPAKLVAESPKKYGLNMDTLISIPSRIRRNETFGQIMRQLNLDPALIYDIEHKDTLFNPARIVAGARQNVILSQEDSIPLFWVYQPDPVNWFRISLSSPAQVVAGKNPVEYRFKAIHGVIETSLWNTAADMDFPFELALQLADIYAWTVDFFDLQKGDNFDVLYEETYVDSVFTGISKIFAARFSQEGNDIYAIPFIQDGKESYYDQEGNSLERAFLKAPLRFRRISSTFSYSRLHPILKIRRPHLGVDYAAPIGTPVHTVGDGKVIAMKHTSGSGRMVTIRHNSIYTTSYLHLSRFARGLYTGKRVKQGETIGYVGSSGLSTGPHLDFRFYKNGTPVDPLKVKSPPVTPIKEENIAAFDSVKHTMIALLHTIQ